jgi:hypothetical protein
MKYQHNYALDVGRLWRQVCEQAWNIASGIPSSDAATKIRT